MPQNKRNYQKELEQILKKEQERKPRLLLHSCCAPCSSYVLEYLSAYFQITVPYYNPNIYPEEEYWKRKDEQKRLTKELTAENSVKFMEASYCPDEFYGAVKGLEQIPEGGERCRASFSLRLKYTARQGAKEKFDYFTTTLTISPLKNAQVINAIGKAAGEEYGIAWLPSDFKKKDGYKRSIELSKEYGLYRQDYCGCVFSKKEREKFLAREKSL